MQNVPYQLENGLFLEEAGVLLPWFKSLNQITKRGGKPLPIKGKTTQLYWESEKVFGGLNVAVQAMERGSGMFFLNLKSDLLFSSAKEEYFAISIILEKLFGHPHSEGITEGYPWKRWFYGNVCVSLALAERYVDYVAFSVSKDVIVE